MKSEFEQIEEELTKIHINLERIWTFLRKDGNDIMEIKEFINPHKGEKEGYSISSLFSEQISTDESTDKSTAQDPESLDKNEELSVKSTAQKDWSNYCATNKNRKQCNKNCIIYPICLIKDNVEKEGHYFVEDDIISRNDVEKIRQRKANSDKEEKSEVKK